MLEERELISKKKNPSDGRGVLLYLTDEGKEKRELSKNTVLQFNDTIKKHTTEEQLKNFVEVAEIINQLIAEKKIFKDK